MGVFIHNVRLKEKVSDTTDRNTYYELMGKYDAIGEEIINLAYDVMPFEKGVYTYESGNKSLDFSYSGYDDFLSRLREEDDCAFLVTLETSGIENIASYKDADVMVHELEDLRERVFQNFKSWDNGEYGEYMCQQYDRYIKVLKECVDMKGLIVYT